MQFFTNEERGKFNSFDFAIVGMTYVLYGVHNEQALGAVRMMRLLRLLTFVKAVRELSVIVSGLLSGMQSVSYIVALLILIIYMFSIL